MQNVMGILFCDYAEFTITSEAWRACQVARTMGQTAKKAIETIGLELIDFDGVHGRIVEGDPERMKVSLWSKRWRERQQYQ